MKTSMLKRKRTAAAKGQALVKLTIEEAEALRACAMGDDPDFAALESALTKIEEMQETRNE